MNNQTRVAGLAQNIFWRYVETGITAGSSVVMTAYVFRRIGAAEFGVFTVITALAAIISLFDFSLSLTVIRSSAAEKEAESPEEVLPRREEVLAAHAAYTGIGALGLPILLVATIVFPHLFRSGAASTGAVMGTALLVGASMLLSMATASYAGVAYGHRQFGVLAGASVVGAVLRLGAVFAFAGSLGLISLGIAQLASTIGSRVILAGWLARSVKWFRLIPALPRSAEVRRVTSFALPLLIMGIATYALTTTDIIVVGAMSSAASVGLYKVGNTIPTQAASILFNGYDVVFPVLVTPMTDATQLRAARLLTRAGCVIGSAGFGCLIFLRTNVVTLMTGKPSHLASSVLVLFCFVWIANLWMHGMGLLLIAKGQHGFMTRIVVAEVIVNMAATVVLVAVIGPVGSAVATLGAITITHVVVIPTILTRRFGMPMREILAVDCVLPTVCGLGAAAIAVLLVSPLDQPILRIAVAAAVAGAIGAGMAFGLLGEGGRALARDSFRRRHRRPSLQPG